MLKRFGLILLLLVMTAIFSCDQDDGGENYPTATEDLGKECLYDCYDEWCFKMNHPWCSAQICVGEADEMYCSTYCMNQNSCPDGYVCTLNCDLKSPDTYCVTDDNYTLLIEMGLCPLLEE